MTSLGDMERARPLRQAGEGDTLGEDSLSDRLPLDPHLSSGDLTWVVDALAESRDDVLWRWSEAVAEQSFHAGRRPRAVADDIPRLYDALLAFLQRGAPPWREPGSPLDDEDVLAAARSHAHTRVSQGLKPGEVVTEFRLLRREIWRALRSRLSDEAPHPDVISTELLVNDALDGAIAMGLTALTSRIEEVREDFLVTTIHEVRQPITAIKGTAQFAKRLLRRPTVDMAQVNRTFDQIAQHADRMTELLDLLTDASRAALGNLQLNREMVDLEELVRRSVASLPPNDAARVQLRLPGNLQAFGEWDRRRIQQVTTNLLTNAAKYSGADQPIDVAVVADEREAHVSVRDRGIGIASDDLSQIFTRYFRSQTAVDDGIEGLGLGLYLAQQIIDAHGGRIWAASDGPGTGTTFAFTLPKASPEPAD